MLNETFNITFNESGLPRQVPPVVGPHGAIIHPGVSWNWTIKINASSGEAISTNSSSDSSVGFQLPNGTYTYAVGPVIVDGSTYLASPQTVGLVVNGSSLELNVTFAQGYAVAFNESGLPSGTNWSIEIWNNATGQAWNQSEPINSGGVGSSPITFVLPNGTYNYTVGNASTANLLFGSFQSGGNISLNGTNSTIHVAFDPIEVAVASPASVRIGNVQVSVTSSKGNAYNDATITFAETGIGPFTNTLRWSLRPSHGGYERGSASSSLTSFSIPYLNPGSTFYYKIVATGSFTSGVHTGSFVTPPIVNTPQVASGDYYGYVLTASGVPIAGAKVTAKFATGESGTCTSCSATTTTNSAGYYAIQDYGTCYTDSGGYSEWYMCPLDNWFAWVPLSSSTPYWSENWTLAQEPNSARGWDWQTFYLTPVGSTSPQMTNQMDGQDGVADALAFVHTSNVYCAVNAGYTVTNTVYAYAAGSGSSDIGSFTQTETFPGTGTPTDYGDSVAIMNEYQISGGYVIKSNGGIKLKFAEATGSPTATAGVYYDGNDPVTTPPALGGNAQLIDVQPGTTFNQGFEADGTVSFTHGLDYSLGISVGEFVSESISVEFNTGVTGSQTQFSGVSCTLGMLVSSWQYFEIYSQGGDLSYQGIVYHIWQCAAATGGGQPSSCDPIDEP